MHGLEQIQNGMPICLRLMREMHDILLSTGRGYNKQPGEFRQSQNWIGGTRPGNAIFVPPPPERVQALMSDLERFIHADTPDIPTLIKAGMVHVQFETIHPFLDGNGRLGRLLITLILCGEDALAKPILSLSLYFKTHRQRYYDLLQQVRERGDWEAWLIFFLEGIAETSSQSNQGCLKMSVPCSKADRHRIRKIGRPAASALRLHDLLQRRPIITILSAAREVSLSAPTVAASIRHLQKLGILREATGKQRRRIGSRMTAI